MENYIEEDVYNVLTDSKTDPQYSAVTTTNLIKCYIHVMTSLGCSLPYQDLKGYFEHNLISPKEYLEFEVCRKKESEYYIGEIF